MTTLEGKKVFVLGGSSGMGRAAAKAAALAGAKVTIASRSADKLNDAAKEIGNTVSTLVLDATDEAAVNAFFAGSGTWDHIVCSAGAGGRGDIKQLSTADVMTAMNSKFWSYFRVARAAKVADGGSITFVSGQFGHRPIPGTAIIGAVNAAIEGLTRGLAIDFAPVRVNTVCPGLVDTPQWDRMPKEAREAMFDKLKKTLPVRRVGMPDDVGHAIIFAMTNPYATGSVILLDGGAVIGEGR